MTRSSRENLYWLGLSVLLSGPVHAGDAARAPSSADSAAVSSQSPGQLAPGLKSSKTALLLSFLGTAAPLAASLPFIWESSGTSLAHTTAVIGVGAVVIGPSLGHFYAGRPGRAFAGIGLRVLAGAGVAIAGLGSGAEGGATSGQAALGVAGGIVGAASVIWDIASAPHSARVHNEQARHGLTLTDVRLTDDSRGIGLRATVAF